MSRVHIDPEDDFAISFIVVPKFCHPFGWFPISDPRISEPACCQNIWILSIRDVRIWAVRGHILECLLISYRVPPFDPFGRRKWKGLI